jgi:hypothetical protein
MVIMHNKQLLLLGCCLGAASGFGPTFGNGIAGVPVCGSSRAPQNIVNHTLSAGETHGVLHHFWVTGADVQVGRMWVDYFIDGEATPSISFQPAMMCGLAFPERLAASAAAPNKEYAAGALCGKTAPSGGWYNTFPVPFYESVLVQVRADEALDGPGCFNGYVNVRGTVGLPLALPGSGVPLPAGARLWLQRNEMAARQPLEYVTVAQLAPGQAGMVFLTAFGVEAQPVGGSGAGGGYIEGCWTFYRQHNEPFPGLVVGTGVEDYFDSAYYFGADSGGHTGLPFSTPLNGLTLFERTADGYERLSAYRFHNADPLAMSDGGRLVWRVGAQGAAGTTKCGNPIPQAGAPTTAAAGAAAGAAAAAAVGAAGAQRVFALGRPGGNSPPLGRTLSAINMTSYGWVYTWDGTPPPPLPTPAPVAPTPTPTPPAPTPDSGCADGSCDALCALQNVRGCTASWAGAVAMNASRSGGGIGAALAACGDALPCTVPADACADGWSICAADGDTAAFAAALSAAECAGATPSAKAAFVGATSHAGADHECTAGRNHGCHGDWGGEPICCGSGCVTPSCPDSIWPGKTIIHIGDGPGGVCSAMSSGGAIKGVLCCRDQAAL